MRDKTLKIIEKSCSELFDSKVDIILTRPEKQFGDFSTNVALQLAPIIKKSPILIAQEIAQHITEKAVFASVMAINPGFININLKDSDVYELIKVASEPEQIFKGKQILVEYGDLNPFKEMHLGHVYSTIIGDTISSLLKSSGGDVKSLSYHGDVGLNIAKGIYGIGEHINWDITMLDSIVNDKSLGYFYAEGEKAFNSNPQAADRIKSINLEVYNRSDELINRIYDFGKKLSFDQFDKIFAELRVHFDKRYLESESAVIGKKIVEDYIGKVFEQSEGAIIFRGEEVGLYTSVFINSQGLPTYQAKDLGLTQLKKRDYPGASSSIIITGNEQIDYFRVVFAALAKIDPILAKETIHLSHGFLSLNTGKMSSRTGDVFTGSDLIDGIKIAIEKQYPDSKVKNEIFLSAIRYTFIKQRIGADIVFNPEESIAIEGNSGPYIQYAHARARSILTKLTNLKQNNSTNTVSLEQPERDLIIKISQFNEVVEQSAREYMPHHICTYLFQLAQEFNKFYENNRVKDDPRETLRAEIVKSYARILKTGLELLHIPAPEYM
jgi:arginyl-tRNA synthetase